MTQEQQIELFFFDPNKTRDEYIDFYKKLNPDRFNLEKGGYRYSPLFLLLKDIRYCLGVGKEFNSNRGEFHFAEFAGVILLRICFTNVVKKVFSGTLYDFAFKYMNITDNELLDALNELRNALEHNFYSLRTIQKSTQIEYAFALGFSFNKPIQFLVDGNTSNKKILGVNPRKLFRSFEEGVKKLKVDLLDPKNIILRNKFSRSFKMDDWVLIK